jgi:hypothetical protein
MTDNSMDVIYYALMLILPVSALAARRLPLGETIKMGLAWVAIFGILFVLVVLWQGAVGTGSALGGLFG